MDAVIDEINGLELGQSAEQSFKRLLRAAFFLTAIAAVIPIGSKILDVLWICSFCLSGAIVVICLFVRNSSELAGFVSVISGLTFLRLAAQAGTARHVIKDEPSGILLGSAASLVSSGQPLTVLFICLFISLVILFAVFAFSQKIALASKGYREVYPLKCMGIQTDLRLGVINKVQADILAKRVRLEDRFFYGMQNASVLMRSEAIIFILTLLVCLLLAVTNRGSREFKDVLSVIVPQAAALSAFALVPSLIVAAACGGMMSKRTLAVTEQSSDSQSHVRTIKVIPIDSYTAIEDTGETRIAGIPEEHIVEFEPVEALPAPSDIYCRNTNEYYEKVSNIIYGLKTRPKVILLASEKTHSLPVTVAVNIAIRLAQKKQKVLLVDTDEQRNAVAHVFDLDADSLRKKVQPSMLENLSVCCAPARKFNSFLRQTEVLNHFDAVLIYTPDVETMQSSKADIQVRPGAFYFGDEENSENTAAQKLLFCGWLCVIPSIQSVLDSGK